MSGQRKFVTRRRVRGSEMRTFSVRIARSLADSLDEIKGSLNRSQAFEKLIDAELRRCAKKANKAAAPNSKR